MSLNRLRPVIQRVVSFLEFWNIQQQQRWIIAKMMSRHFEVLWETLNIIELVVLHAFSML